MWKLSSFVWVIDLLVQQVDVWGNFPPTLCTLFQHTNTQHFDQGFILDFRKLLDIVHVDVWGNFPSPYAIRIFFWQADT